MSGATSRAVYSWDTCVFLAMLKEEEDKPLADIIAVAQEIELGKADLIVSTIVITELLDIIDDKQLADDFHAFIQRPNVKMVNVDARIARKTAEVRASWRADRAHETENRNITVPDAIIAVTAMRHEADVLHSFDDRLTRHHQTALVDNLDIIHPVLSGGRRVIPFDVATADTTSGETDAPSEATGTGQHPDTTASDSGAGNIGST